MIENVFKRKDFKCPEEDEAVYFVCMNHTDYIENPVHMKVKEGRTSFYACPKYFLKDEKHPDGHARDEPMCQNRISMADAYSILGAYEKKLNETISGGWMTAHLTNWEFDYKSYHCLVIRDKRDKLVIGVLNTKAVW